MTGPDPIGSELRREHRIRRLGRDDACCTLCGESELVLLRRASRRLIEFHHLAGRANDPELGVFLCLNHHTILTEAMRAGIPLSHLEQRTQLERLEASMRGRALFAALDAEVSQARADDLAELISALDHAHPEWRQLPEAGG